MSAARGIVDLGSATTVQDGTLYRAVEETGHFIHVPGALQVAPREDGSADPDISLELIRGQSPFLPPSPYGVFDIRVGPPDPAGAALDAARALDPAAFVTPAVFEEGYLRLQVIAGQAAVDVALLDELERPAWVASNGLDSARMIRRLTPDAALVLRDALLGGALTMSAAAEMTLRGLAERAPVTISFAPRRLFDALVAQADDQSRISVDAIVALWMRDDAVPLLQATGMADVERSRLARILADWTIATFATPVAAADEQIVATVQLHLPPSMGDAMTWDLTRGRTTRRIVVLRLDPFEAARQLVAAGGLDRVWSETVVPPIETGVVHIDIDTNLPHPIRGLARAGVQLRAAPHPPDRVHELSDALLFDERQEAQRIVWRMSPREPFRYEYNCFALLREGTTTRRLDGPVTPSDRRRLLVGVGELPVDLVSIGAGDRLLSEATVRGVCARDTQAPTAATERVEFELSAAQPRLAVAVAPGTAEHFSVHVEACPLDGGTCVALTSLPARSLKLDMSSFAQFGPQVVDISVDFDVDAPLVALDLLAEGDADEPLRAAVLSFTPTAPGGQWRYFNSSPFRSGYRYRPHDSGDEAWSDIRPAGAPLSVRASDVTSQANPAPTGQELPPDGFRFEDLYCYPGEEPDSHLVIPLVPGPELDGAGRPVMMTIPLGDRGLLQLGIHLGPDGDSLERLRVEIARRSGADISVLRLQVAPIEVAGVTLAIAGTDGVPHELARRQSSNFPPYTAIFSEQLETEQLKAVAAASAGESGRLVASFDARVEQRVTVSTVMRGDIAAIVARTTDAADDDRAHVASDAIDDAILTGALRVVSNAPPDAPSELLARARERAADELLVLVLALSRAGDAAPASQAPTELRVTHSEPSWRALAPTIDIASWFAPRSPLQPTAP